MDFDLNICTIGGGSGMPVVNKALVRAGFSNIKSVVTTFDSGGDSGRMRTDERGRILAFSDYWRSLMSLWKDGKQRRVWEEMLKFRDGRGRNFGNTFFQFMEERAGDLSKVDLLFSTLTKAKLMGEVIPVALRPATLCFETRSGKTYAGEHQLDDLRMSKDTVTRVWLEPQVKATDEARAALARASLIVVCPGSMHGSVIVNLLPAGMRDAFVESEAKKILLTNIMSVANENGGFDQNDYLKIFERYLNCRKCFDLVVMADMSKLNRKMLRKSLENYEMEGSFPIKYNKEEKVKTMVEDIALIEKKNYRLRHDDQKLSKLFLNLNI